MPTWEVWGFRGYFSTLSGYLARKMGYRYWTAWLWGFVFPAILGGGLVILIHALGGGGCRVIVSLSTTLVVVMVYALIKPRLIEE